MEYKAINGNDDSAMNKTTHVAGAPIGRRNFIKLSAAGAAMAMATSVVGCAPSTTGSNKEGTYSAGTYSGTGKGKKGNIVVNVTFSDSAIESIEVTDSKETERIAAMAFERIPQDVIELQSLNVDTTTGATLASMGLIDAIADCVDQAGGNSNDLRTGEARAKKEDTVEISQFLEQVLRAWLRRLLPVKWAQTRSYSRNHASLGAIVWSAEALWSIRRHRMTCAQI